MSAAVDIDLPVCCTNIWGLSSRALSCCICVLYDSVRPHAEGEGPIQIAQMNTSRVLTAVMLQQIFLVLLCFYLYFVAFTKKGIFLNMYIICICFFFILFVYLFLVPIFCFSALVMSPFMTLLWPVFCLCSAVQFGDSPSAEALVDFCRTSAARQDPHACAVGGKGDVRQAENRKHPDYSACQFLAEYVDHHCFQ